MRQTDNQQATLDFIRGWLGAAIDCDGTVGCHRTSTQYNRNYKPTVKIFNTNVTVIDRAHDYLTILDIPHYIRIASSKYHNKTCKPCYSVTIEGFKRCSTALPKLIPCLCAKRRQAEIVLEICQSRLSTPMTRRNKDRLWTDKEHELLKNLGELNAPNNRRKPRESSTTMSKAG